MKNIGIIGMGLIGGSMAKAIHKYTECTIYGFDANEEVIKSALDENVIAGKLDDASMLLCDMIIVSLYPKDVVDKILSISDKLRKGTIVVDCTGIKQKICNSLSQRLNEDGICFIGGHPMAGREVSGYYNALPDLFTGASMILCTDEYTDATAFESAKEFFMKLRFASIKETTAAEHDRVIAYTSQLAHVVSNSYIKSDTLPLRVGFSAGSYKDLTRVAKLNENMWTDLFIDNKECLLDEIDSLCNSIGELRDALFNEDKERLCELLKQGRILKENDEKIL